MELKGERVLLREFEPQDVGALHVIHSDPRVLRFYAPDVGTLERTRALVALFVEWANDNPRQNFQLAIIDSRTNLLLGSCGVRTKDCPPGEAEFGIGIAQDRWGTGVAQDAAQTILRFGFSELGLKEVRAVTVSDNEAVTKFARRMGFTAGPPRQGDAWMTQRGWSAVDWSLTREIWENTISMDGILE